MFTEDDLEDLHRATLDHLGETGVVLGDEEVLDGLRNAGCEVVETSRVKIPSGLIESALDRAPGKIRLFTRTGEPALEIGCSETFLGSGINQPNTLDLVRSERRSTVLADVTAFSRLGDALPNVDVVTSRVWEIGAAADAWDRRAFFAMLGSTTKPIAFAPGSTAGLKGVIQMAEMVAGSAENLSTRPFVVPYLDLDESSGLLEDALDQMKLSVTRGLPWVLGCRLSLVGEDDAVANTPAVAANASLLAMLTYAQSCRPGSPVVPGVASDLEPRSRRLAMALTTLIHERYRLPVWSSGGVSDSKLPDIQAGIETALSLSAAISCGVDLVLESGSLESGEVGSFEMVVIADEVMGNLRQLETGGHEREVSLFDRSHRQGWVESGRPNMIRSARDRAIELIGSHESEPLTRGIAAELQAIVASADQESNVEG